MRSKGESMRRLRLLTILLILATAASVSCGGGGDSAPGGGGGTTIYSGSFTPDNANPGANTVSVAGSGNTNIVTLWINVSGTNDVSGAAFDVNFDPTMVQYAGWSPGQLLEQGNHQVTYQLNSQQSGRVIVGVSRTTAGTGANATVATPIIVLQFRVTRAGSSSLGFENADLLNSANPPVAKSGISFSGGTLTAS